MPANWCGQDDVLRVILGEINPYPSIDEGKTESPLAVEARDQDVCSRPLRLSFRHHCLSNGSTSLPADDVVSEIATSSDTANSPPETPTETAHESLPRLQDTRALPQPWGCGTLNVTERLSICCCVSPPSPAEDFLVIIWA